MNNFFVRVAIFCLNRVAYKSQTNNLALKKRKIEISKLIGCI